MNKLSDHLTTSKLQGMCDSVAGQFTDSKQQGKQSDQGAGSFTNHGSVQDGSTHF